MTEKFIINQNGEIEDTMTHITFDSFMEILIVLNGQSRQLNKLWEENEQLKQKNNELKHKYSLLLDENYKEVVSLEEENEQLKKYKTLFNQLQLQLKDVKKASDLDSKDFEDLLLLSQGKWFEQTDEHIGWKRVDLE